MARARLGGVRSLLKSFGVGQLSMSERGKLGGRPKELTLSRLALSDLDAVNRGAQSVSRKELAPESTTLRPDPRHPAASP